MAKLFFFEQIVKLLTFLLFLLPSSSQEKCAFCLEEMKSDEIITELKCTKEVSHRFHTYCIVGWTKGTCPMCRRPIKSPLPKQEIKRPTMNMYKLFNAMIGKLERCRGGQIPTTELEQHLRVVTGKIVALEQRLRGRITTTIQSWYRRSEMMSTTEFGEYLAKMIHQIVALNQRRKERAVAMEAEMEKYFKKNVLELIKLSKNRVSFKGMQKYLEKINAKLNGQRLNGISEEMLNRQIKEISEKAINEIGTQ